MKLRLPTPQDVAHQTVLVRVDYNVPLRESANGWEVADGRRIEASLETIRFLLENQAKVILMSHLGRPEVAQGEDFAAALLKNERYSLAPAAVFLQQVLSHPVQLSQTSIFEAQQLRTELAAQVPGTITLLENIRLYFGEEENDSALSQALGSLADVYLNEAFSTSHRGHASTLGVTKFLPSFAGFGLAQEVETLNRLLTEPKRPFVIVVGGAKISDKVGALEHLTKIADAVLVGGGVANNFLKAEGLETHHSYLEDTPVDEDQKGVDYVAVAQKLLTQTKTEKIIKDDYIPLPKILYPLDVIAAPSPESTEVETIDLTRDAQDTPNDRDLMYLDIGPRTIRLYTELLKQAGSVFWNGPMGVFEKTPFTQGTQALATALAQATVENQVQSVLGGGDTVAAVEALGLEGKFSYISTAGSAGLEFLSGQTLPAIEPLIEANITTDPV